MKSSTRINKVKSNVFTDIHGRNYRPGDKISIQINTPNANGFQGKLIGILEVLDEDIKLSDAILGELTGEGHAEEDGKTVCSSVDSRLHEVLTRACNLRGSLQRIMDSIEPAKKKSKQANKATESGSSTGILGFK